ncbi:MAG: hypothetical protein WCF84_00405 [Anaerolineae bacterium]
MEEQTIFELQSKMSSGALTARELAEQYLARMDRIMQECLDAMQRLGVVLVDPANVEPVKELEPTELAVLLYEFKADLNAYLAQRGETVAVHSLQELIPRRGCRLSAHHPAGRIRPRPAHRRLVLCRAVSGGPAHPVRLRAGAGDAGPPAAEIFAYYSPLKTGLRLLRKASLPSQ